MHYDLRSPTPSESSVPPLIHDMPKTSLKDAKATMHEMKNELKNELITLEEYNELFISLRSSLGPPKSLSDLERIPHSTLAIVSPGELPTDINDDPLTGYLSPSHEEEYLAALDASIDGLPLNIESHPIRDLKRDSETPIKNPVSVYNWLRRNQPQVFLQDADTANSYGEQIVAGVSGAPEKSTPAHTGTRKGARASKVAVEEEVVDDEGNVITVTSATTRGGRGKRKREDDAYRPKGGTGRQTRKRMSVGRGAAD